MSAKQDEVTSDAMTDWAQHAMGCDSCVDGVRHGLDHLCAYGAALARRLLGAILASGREVARRKK